MRCLYCNKEFEKGSEEHIIHNAIGGLLTSDKICCHDCNNMVSKKIDDDFCKIFSPFSSILNLNKSHGKNSKPSYEVLIEYEGKKYTAIYKGNTFVDCVMLKKELRQNITDEIISKFKLIGIKFNIQNDTFYNGIRKIAINFALNNNIDKSIIQNLNISEDQLEFNQIVIPFVPLTYIDQYIEAGTEDEIYHSLILFISKKKMWCYIELFSTFKFYVLLNSGIKEDDKLIASYCQFIEKQDRSPKTFHVRRPKDAFTLSRIYNVECTLDIDELHKRINKSIQVKDYLEDFYVRNYRLSLCDLQEYFLEKSGENERLKIFLIERKYYFEELEYGEKILNKNRFRILLPKNKSYPEEIIKLLRKNKNFCSRYTNIKFKQISNRILEKFNDKEE